ncbi:MAG: small ribosomal subunit Rsm22 family protein [Verrucomicrobiae bacterium]|nr:small ribosomal subunit Rsm22 family protein [Verrucomicrobiae bacterium]
MHSIDWKVVKRLRAAFLAGTAAGGDYWTNESELQTYDATFARRIGWKWDYVLAELKRRNWFPPGSYLLDWGCGTGVASRKFVEHFGRAARVYLCDRSPLAMQFAARQLREHVGEVWQESIPPRSVDILLISHAIAEQPEPFVLPCEATSVIIVEPGTYESSHRLIALRERLRSEYHIVAPCPHQGPCGLLAAVNKRHWCHQFAPSPPEAFTQRHWAQFAKLAGVDLRSLPLSYLVLDRRTFPNASRSQVLGRPRVYKAHALVLTCDASGVQDRRITKRDAPEEFRRLRKTRLTP